MIDAVQVALRGEATRSVWAPALSLLAGLISSFGPCIAPRFVAIASLTAGTSGAKRWIRVFAFVAGLCTSYVVLGTIAGALGYVARYSTTIYSAIAGVLALAGLATLLRREHAAGCSSHAHAQTFSRGAAFIAGAGFAAVSSPCCGPIAAALAGIGTAAGNARFGAMMLAAFALGHALPLLALAGGSMRVVTALSLRLAPALSTVSGALMVALGGYYALLA